jgi:hypothetical protein
VCPRLVGPGAGRPNGMPSVTNSTTVRDRPAGPRGSVARTHPEHEQACHRGAGAVADAAQELVGRRIAPPHHPPAHPANGMTYPRPGITPDVVHALSPSGPSGSPTRRGGRAAPGLVTGGTAERAADHNAIQTPEAPGTSGRRPTYRPRRVIPTGAPGTSAAQVDGFDARCLREDPDEPPAAVPPGLSCLT